MKKKKSKAVWIIIILVIILCVIIVMSLNQDKEVNIARDTSIATTSKVSEVVVGTQTIENTLSSSGQILSNETENLELNTYRYFKEIYVEENDYISEGENILKYTNGTYLTAPYNCVITKISVPDSGERCMSNNYITIESTQSLYMSLNIDETEIGKVTVGQEVSIVPNAFEDKTYDGKITKINQIGNYASNGSSFTATVEFENDGELKIGMSASATVTIEKAEDVIAVPIEAVQTAKESKYVIVKQNDGTTKNVNIETGISNDAYVEVKSGLSGGETIQMTVTTNSNNMKNGMDNMKGGMQGFEGMKQGGESMGGPGGQGMPSFGN